MSWQEPLIPTDTGGKFWDVVEAVSAARYPLPWTVLRTLQNADTIPADKLPILAWALSVDIWHESWPIEKKRSVVRTAIGDQILKGTLAGVRRYVEIEDAEVVDSLTPPQMAFASRIYTKEEQEAWLADLPQLRIYWRVRPVPDAGLAFTDDGFADDGFGGFDPAAAYYGRHPVLYDRGTVTELQTSTIITTATVASAVTVERVSVPGLGGVSFCDAGFADDAFSDDAVTAPQLFTMALDQSYIHEQSELALNVATPSLQPVNVRFTRGSDIGDASRMMFADDGCASSEFACEDQGAFMVFDRVYLNDPTRTGHVVDAVTFCDHSRLGMPLFTAEFMIKLDGVEPEAVLCEGDFLDDGFAVDEDPTRLNEVLDAVALSKGFKNKGLVTFETTRARTWGDGIPLDGTITYSSRVDASL